MQRMDRTEPVSAFIIPRLSVAVLIYIRLLRLRSKPITMIVVTKLRYLKCENISTDNRVTDRGRFLGGTDGGLSRHPSAARLYSRLLVDHTLPSKSSPALVL